MSNVYTSIDQLIGHTPLLELTHFEADEDLKARVLVKLEYFNPAGSVKDRVAKNMIDEAEKAGKLVRGGDYTIIEPTSGNTGVGIASVAAARGYKVIITMPETMSVERRKLMQAYGAQLVLTDGSKGMKGAIAKADELAKEGISAEVIDPRTLVPFDYDTVAESVKKTGRLVVVHEAHQNNGWGAQVVSQVSQMVFPYLDAAPVHIGAKACPLPFNLGLEQAVLPSVKDIVDACKASLYR